jgi:hypothetical protein
MREDEPVRGGRGSRSRLRARAINVLAVALLAGGCLADAADATPTVYAHGEAVPIPGYPETGNIYGAGAAVLAEYRISGTEYEGSPPPLAGINVYLPRGTTLHTAGFKTCPPAVLEPAGLGPAHCPAASRAGPPGEVHGFVTLGGERVKEAATVESFFAPGGGLEFFTHGHTPVSVEVLSTGRIRNPRGAGGFGPEFETQIPLVESLPGAPYASVESIRVKVGGAYGPTSPKKATYYGRVPKKGQCPKGGFRAKTEVIFAAVAGLPLQTVTKELRVPCPRRSLR